MHVISLEMGDRAEKHMALRHLVEQAKRLRARVFLVNEVWLKQAEEIADELFAIEPDAHGEPLVLNGLTDDGKFLSCTAQFHRVGGAIVFEPDQLDNSSFPNILRPFCDVWGIQFRSEPHQRAT